MREDAILHKMQIGDPSGLESLMDIYIPYVSTVVWNILRGAMSPEDGEEVVSDVFLAAWQQSSELKSGHVKGWLATVARNKAKNKLRQMGSNSSFVKQSNRCQHKIEKFFYDIITTLKQFKRSLVIWQSMNQPSKQG